MSREKHGSFSFFVDKNKIMCYILNNNSFLNKDEEC